MQFVVFLVLIVLMKVRSCTFIFAVSVLCLKMIVESKCLNIAWRYQRLDVWYPMRYWYVQPFVFFFKIHRSELVVVWLENWELQWAVRMFWKDTTIYSVCILSCLYNVSCIHHQWLQLTHKWLHFVITNHNNNIIAQPWKYIMLYVCKRGLATI